MKVNKMEKRTIRKIAKIRKEKGLTQTELAEITGNSQQVISKIEKEKSSPQLKTLCAILNALDCELIVKNKNDDKIIDVTRDFKIAKECYERSVSKIDMDAYEDVVLNAEEKKKYLKCIEGFKSAEENHTIGTTTWIMADAIVNLRVASDMFKNNPNKVNFELLEVIYQNVDIIRETLKTEWLDYTDECLSYIEDIFNMIGIPFETK